MGLGEEILDLSDVRTKQVTVDAWKKTLTIRELGLHEFLQSRERVHDGEVDFRALDIAQTIAASVIDKNGERVFSDEQVPKLARKNRRALMFLYNEILELSGSSEDLEKN